MNEGYVLYVIDTETTGLDAEKNDVIEASFCRLNFLSENVDREQKTWLFKALNPDTIEAEALAINGHKREDILGLTTFGENNYLHPKDVIPEIENWIMDDNMSAMDRIFVGQNPIFDINALKALWKRVDSLETFPFELERNNRVLDVKQLAVLVDLCIGKRRRYYNLGNLVKSFGVKKGKAHQAAEDVRMTTDILMAILTPLKTTIQENFKECYTNEDKS